MQKTFLGKIAERKFFVPVITAIVILVTAKFGVEIPEEAMDAIVMLVLAFLGVEGAKDVAAVIKSKGTPTPPKP